MKKILSVPFLQNIHKQVFYLLIIFFPTQLGYHFWPSWALVLGRRVDYLSPTLFFTDILIVLLLVFWCIESTRKTKKGKAHRKIHTSFFIISLFAVINILFAVNRTVAIWTWIKLFELFFLGLYIVKTKPDGKRVIFFLSISVFYSSALAVWQFILQHSVGGLLWFLGERTFTAATPGIAQIPLCMPGVVNCPLTLRPYATFPHPNVLGGHIATILPLVVWQLLNSKNQKSKIFYGLTILLGCVALLLTFSRSAWVVGILGITTTYFVLRRPNKYIITSVLFLIVCFIAFVTLAVHFESESVVVRQQLAGSAIAIWKSAPLSGVGLGNFLVALPRYLPSRTIYFLQPVHNIYLLLLSEVGIIGLTVLCWIVWKVFQNKPRKNNAVRIVCYVSLIAFLILGCIDHYPLSLQQGRLLLTLFIALVLA